MVYYPSEPEGTRKSKSAWDDLNSSFWAYLIVQQIIINAIMNGGFNALFAWLSFRHDTEVRLWGWPSPFVGDIFVTSIVQPFFTWVIGGAFASADARKRKAMCFSGLPNTPYPQFLSCVRWILTPESFVRQQGEPCHSFFIKLGCAVRGGLLFALPFIFLVGGGVTGVTTAIVGYGYRFRPDAALIYKAVLGASMSVIISPTVAWLAFAAPDTSKTDETDRLIGSLQSHV
eukprot:TRINITY_DN10244_c0_g1_i1.p1 TRINITY_DN10244_c0_g1~~TRINITY_DN10244_c0_g1_i1.p1  ORF type:complete len:230 (-),score=1.09 TRINITY_DN10244_c0_g1_i1:280-969(-)